MPGCLLLRDEGGAAAMRVRADTGGQTQLVGIQPGTGEPHRPRTESALSDQGAGTGRGLHGALRCTCFLRVAAHRYPWRTLHQLLRLPHRQQNPRRQTRQYIGTEYGEYDCCRTTAVRRDITIHDSQAMTTPMVDLPDQPPKAGRTIHRKRADHHTDTTCDHHNTESNHP